MRTPPLLADFIIQQSLQTNLRKILDTTVNPRSCLYSIGLSPAKDSLMRFRLYQLIWPGRTAPRKKISVKKKCELLQMANIGSMVVAVFFNDRMPRASYQFFLASIYQCETFGLILRPFVA